MKLTWIDLNSWLFEIGNQTILVDPWLVDPLIFYGQPWLFTAYHKNPPCFTPNNLPQIDAILISQGVDDHCHLPTLDQLDRQIQVIASLPAFPRLKNLGYEKIIPLSHGEEYCLNHQVKIMAISGANLQPGQEENGYFLQDLTQNKGIYYEPHWGNPEKIRSLISTIDVMITPMIAQIFPFLGKVIMGPSETLNLIQSFHPQYFLPTTLGEIDARGILPKLVRSQGSIEEFRELLVKENLLTQFLPLQPGEGVKLFSS